MAESIDDRRVRHFHDPKRRVGKLLGQSLGKPDLIAWDIYLFYSAGTTWDQMPPQPTEWAHQLSDREVDHYHFGNDLEQELRKIAERLLQS